MRKLPIAACALVIAIAAATPESAHAQRGQPPSGAVRTRLLRGYRDAGRKIHIIHFDAHQDFGPKLDRATGVPLIDQGNHLTHAIDLPWITGISMLGLRGMARGGGATASQVETQHIDRTGPSKS
jgi:hypothetical protein